MIVALQRAHMALASVAAAVALSSSNAVLAQSPDVVGQWGPVMSWPHVAVSMANLPDGRILTWSGSERRTWPSTEQTYSGTWDPATNEFVEYFFEGHNMFCAHLAMTEEGGVFVNGGRNSGNSPWTSLFNYTDNAWEVLPNMASGGRWYPTTLALGDGTIMTAMGNSSNVRNPDLWDPATGWRVLNGIDFISLRQNNNEIRRENVFPLLSLTPSGEVFHFWDVEENHLIDASGNGTARTANPLTDGVNHAGGIQVNYDIGKLLISGANDGSWGGNSSAIFPDAFTVDLNGSAPVIESTNPMSFPRKFHQMIPLPTGEVLVVGGNTTGAKFQDNGSVMPAEIWSPDSGQWRTVAALTVPRDYHSTALLLTDGRVITAGGGYHPGNPNSPGTHQDAQIYSPPYLFDSNGNLASRPLVTSASGVVTLGNALNVSTQGDIAYFSLIKMSATTHALNTGARQYRPQFTATGTNTYQIDVNPNPNVSVPGYWMLFAVDTSGVPSVASVIRIARDGAADGGVRNLAPGGSASQSSTYPSGLSFEAANAIDGNTDGQSVSGSITHTQNDVNAWWEIDLGAVYDLTNVRLWNRTDCCASRLADVHVLVSDAPFVSTDLAGTQAQSGVSDFFEAGAAGRTTDVAINRTVRYLRVQLGGRNFLQLAEVQIFGDDLVEELVNVAPLGTAAQSSTYVSGLSFEAANAIDDNTAGNSTSGSITHTQNDAQAWWELDLGNTFEIDNIVLWNRADCCASRLSNFHVLVSDTPFTSTSLGQTQAQAGVTDIAYPGTAGRTTQLAVGRSGRYVRVQLAGTNYLQLAEVQVFAPGGPRLTPLPVAPSANGAQVSFDVQTQGGASGTQYSWNFGDGSGDTPASSSSAITHTYTSPGRYVVSVTAISPSGLETRETFTHVVHRPLTGTRPKASSGIAELAARAQVWVVNPDNDSVSTFASSNPGPATQVQVGREPRALAVAPDGTVWVTNKADATISVVNPATYSVTRTIGLPAHSQPHGMVFSGGSAYVALEAAGQVIRLAVASGSQTGQANVGATPRHLAVDANGQLFVSRFITPPVPNEHTSAPSVGGPVGGQVVRLDPQSMTVISNIVLRHIDRDASEHEGPGLPNYLGPMAVSPDGTQAFVPSKQDNILAGALRGGDGMTFDQTVRAVTSRVDMGTMSEDLYARIDHDNASVASHAVFGRYGVSLFTSLEGNRQIAISDATTNLEYARFDVGLAPQSLALSDDGQRLYVHNFMARSVGVYDVSRVVENGEPVVTEIAVVPTVMSEALAAPVLRGKQLFYDARDDRLAALNYMSCASCHNEGGDDGRVWDFTSLEEGLRNTTTLRGKGGLAHGLLHWTGNFDEVQDFEGQIRDFAGGLGLMSDADFFSGTRAVPLGDPKAFLSDDLDALAAYLASLEDSPLSPAASADGSLSSQAQAGQALFAQAGCATCHSGDQFTDSMLHNIGTITSASGQRLGGTLNGIDTPTLLGLFATAPYLHDGSAQTIEAAIAAHDGVTLSSTERASVARYLDELRPGAQTPPPTGDELLVNGELEAGRTSGWGTASLNGWSSTNPIEVWASGHAGIATQDGGNLVEIDFNGAGAIDQLWQDVATTSGATYELAFLMRARGGAINSADESICVSWRGAAVQPSCFTASAVGVWSQHSVTVTGSGGLDRLMFSESSEPGASDGTGPLLDRISLRGAATVAPVERLTNGALEAGRAAGWGTVAALDGWGSTNRVEVWASGHAGISSLDGGNIVEMDFNGAGAVDDLWQDIDTVASASYTLTFSMRSRSGAFTSASEMVCVEWRGAPAGQGCFTAASAGQWTEHTLTLTGSGGTDRLRFSESTQVGASEGLGPMLDQISLMGPP